MVFKKSQNKQTESHQLCRLVFLTGERGNSHVFVFSCYKVQERGCFCFSVSSDIIFSRVVETTIK